MFTCFRFFYLRFTGRSFFSLLKRAIYRVTQIYLITLLLIFITGLTACGPSFDGYVQSPYGGYSQQAVNYFLEIGLCPEFGTCIPIVRRWKSEVRVQIHGSYSSADVQELESIISELSALTGLSIKRVTGNANINIYFVPQNQFKVYMRNYDLNNPQDGVFNTTYDSSGKYIVKAVICIEDKMAGQKRKHLLREEFTQTLGLQDDSGLYLNSIFQQDPQYTPVEYSVIDKEVIKLLYDKKLTPGMNETQVKQALSVPTGSAVASNETGAGKDGT